MDNFMDKLAQKVTAQEIIRANTTAEIQELGEVKTQVQELRNRKNPWSLVRNLTGCGRNSLDWGRSLPLSRML